MSEIKSGVEEFDLQDLAFRTISLSCFYAAFKNFLRMNGVELTESELFFICGHTGPDSSHVRQQRLDSFDLPYAQFDLLIHNLFSITNTDYEMYYHKDYKYISSDIEPYLFKDKIMMIMVNTSVLSHMDFPAFPNTLTGHCIISSGINDNNQILISDFFKLDSNGKVTTFEGEYDYDIIREGLFGYVHIKNIDREMFDKTIENTLRYAMQEFEDMVCSTGNQSSDKLSIIENMFVLYEELSDEDEAVAKKETYAISLKLQLRHLIFFDYVCDFIDKYLLKDGEEMSREFAEMKQTWQRIINKMLIQTLAFNKKRTKTILKVARELLKRQRELVLQLIVMLKQKYTNL